MIDQITPVILTSNEAQNIGRTLERLAWAGEIVVVDSGSTDDTVAVAARFPSVRFFRRPFDCHSNQWNFAISETGIRTEWILALDADYVLSEALVDELKRLEPEKSTAAYRARFVYCISGKALSRSLYDRVTVLYRKAGASYRQDGHTQRLVPPKGEVRDLTHPIFHDDRKPLASWLASQERYMRIEAEKLAKTPWKDLDWGDRIRKIPLVAPFLVLGYCLFGKGLILEGPAGIHYAFERALAEFVLALHLMKRSLEKKK